VSLEIRVTFWVLTAYNSAYPCSKSREEKAENEIEVKENKFTGMSLSQLKDECRKRKINTSGKKKNDLIELIQSSSTS